MVITSLSSNKYGFCKPTFVFSACRARGRVWRKLRYSPSYGLFTPIVRPENRVRVSR